MAVPAGMLQACRRTWRHCARANQAIHASIRGDTASYHSKDGPLAQCYMVDSIRWPLSHCNGHWNFIFGLIAVRRITTACCPAGLGLTSCNNISTQVSWPRMACVPCTCPRQNAHAQDAQQCTHCALHSKHRHAVQRTTPAPWYMLLADSKNHPPCTPFDCRCRCTTNPAHLV